MVMRIPGINIPSLTMLPESIRPIKHQTYKDRLDESLGMRRGPERDFRQSLADRRDESIGASLGRYGERGLPSLARRKTIPRVTREPRQGIKAKEALDRTSAWPVPIGGWRGDAPVMPSAPKTLEEILAQINETGVPGRNMIGPPGTTISPIQEAVNAAVGPIGGDAEPGLAITDPVQEAVDAAIGGGINDMPPMGPWPGSYDGGAREYLPKDHPFYQSPEYLAWQEKGGIGTMDMYRASDGTQFGSGTAGKMYERWLANQQNQADPVQDAVDAVVGGGAVDEDLGFFDSSWWAENPVGGGDEVPFMDQLQAMVDQILAQQGEQQTAQQQAQQQQAQQAQNYTLTGPSIGYNPYTSGQYQADPYGAAGVPDMGGLTTIPVPQPLTGIGYANANYQAPENMT